MILYHMNGIIQLRIIQSSFRPSPNGEMCGRGSEDDDTEILIDCVIATLIDID